MKASPISVTVALTAIRIRVWSSSASTEPNRKCSRSILVPRTEMMVTPTASEIRKNTASEASSFNSVDARDQTRQQRDDEARDQSAQRHGVDIQARNQEAHRSARQHRMRHRIADERHPPQHQEYADRTGAERKREHADQRAAHEFEFGEGRDEGVVEHELAAPRLPSPLAGEGGEGRRPEPGEG